MTSIQLPAAIFAVLLATSSTITPSPKQKKEKHLFLSTTIPTSRGRRRARCQKIHSLLSPYRPTVHTVTFALAPPAASPYLRLLLSTPMHIPFLYASTRFKT